MSDERDQIMKFFTYDDLPEASQKISKLFCDVAEQVHASIPRSAERSVALRKLLEGKDAAVRAARP